MMHHGDVPTVESTEECAGQILCTVLPARTSSGQGEDFLPRPCPLQPSGVICDILSLMQIKSIP